MLENKNNIYDIEASRFKSNFFEYKSKKIVLYGIGRRTLSLLPRIKDFNIVGLLDRDDKNIGKIIANIPVITIEEARKSDVVIINSDPSNYKTIYKRIYKEGLNVYYSDGIKAKKEDLSTESKNDSTLWEIKVENIKREIDKNDVISFDVFDTLIGRMVLNPSDVYELVGREIQSDYGLDVDYVRRRQEAVISIVNRNASIDEINNYIVEESSLNSEWSNILSNKEIEIEKRIIRPRKDVIELLEYAFKQGKDILFVSDMYFDKNTIKQFVYKYTKVRIEDNAILISCEQNASKREGGLWELVKVKVGNRRLLHIGDDYRADYQVPEKQGFSCISIKKACEMAQKSCFDKVVSTAVSMGDRIAVGMILNYLFGNIELPDSNDKRMLITSKDMGYCVFGPIVWKYYRDLFSKTFDDENSRIIFLARDGYFLYKNYVLLKEKFESYYRKQMPDAIYLPISRRIVLISAIPNKEAWKTFLTIPFDGTYADFIKSRFNVCVDERTKSINNEQWVGGDLNTIEDLISPYIAEIKDELDKEKKDYISFLQEKGIFDSSKKDVLMDLGCQGTNQYYLQKITNKKYTGVYFYANLSQDNYYLQECDISACFQEKNDLHGQDSYIRRKSAILESFFTAPNGMLRCVSEEHNFIYEESKKNQLYFDRKELINEGIIEFLIEYMSLVSNNIGEISLPILQEIFEAVFSGNCKFEKETEESFYFDNDLIGSEEQLVLEV